MRFGPVGDPLEYDSRPRVARPRGGLERNGGTSFVGRQEQKQKRRRLGYRATRLIHHWRRGGMYAGIARDLNADGVSTKRGGGWHAPTVRNIVRRRDWYADVLEGF